VRGVVVANHNMIEQGILEHPTMRHTLTQLGFAEIWVVPMLDGPFDFNKGAGEHFERIIADLAELSGYTELNRAPVVPLGHSACATFPWNFAAWNPARTLAVLSVHGDAPQTTLTGYGRANADWGGRRIDGVPGLMVMGEYEWWEDRLAPAFRFMEKNPAAPIAFRADAGCGHFDYSDDLVAYLALFIRKAAIARLPAEFAPPDTPVTLRPVDPKDGWRMDRWHKDHPPTAPAAPYADYTGDPREAFWTFDAEMAALAETNYATVRGKSPQLLSVTDLQSPPDTGCGEPVTPRFLPAEDGITFKLQSSFMDHVPGDSKTNSNPARWSALPAGTPLGHATGGGPILFSRIVGPFIQTGPATFAYHPGRAEYTADRRNLDMWLLASHPGDEHYKSMVQQVLVRVAPNKQGNPQQITFPALSDLPVGAASVTLHATSDAGLPVSYYVLEGPAEIEGEKLRFTAIPPRAKFPLKITVVAWQFGRSVPPQVMTAERVERSLYLRAHTEP
jgi:hypothetical protein